MPTRLTSAERKTRKAAAMQLFVKRYARKAYPGLDPNDRDYDRQLQAVAKRMRPEQLDELLRDGEDD